MFKKIKITLFVTGLILLTAISGCKKISTDLNINPNVPSVVDAKFLLSGALKNSAALVAGNPGGGSQSGNDLMNLWMGYWTVSGGYIPSAPLLQYVLTDAFGSSIWDNTYLTLENYDKIIQGYGANANSSGARYTAMARIMKAFHYQRLVDTYNNLPYSEALNGGTNNFPKYDNADSVFSKLVVELNACVALINSSATATADNPGTYDIMFGGNMTRWKAFANTTKLKILMRQTQIAGRTAYIQSNLSAMTTADFIGAGADATIQPGYTNSAANQQSPLWNDIGFTTTGSLAGSGDYFRANSYGVAFYKSNNDPRLTYFYTPATSSGVVTGRIFGSTIGSETNSNISAIGGNATGATQTFGTLKSATQAAVILSATESLFLQAEAIERGFLTGSANATYQSAVAESFRILGIPGAATAAATYTAQANNNVNLVASTNRIRTIILQKWAALNTYNPLESWSDWRRLGIPSDLPVSTYPGTTAAHVPYRLIYPTSEYSSNPANAKAQGDPINPITAKIFWMP
jgi:Starch-binding associating with outer membrane